MRKRNFLLYLFLGVFFSVKAQNGPEIYPTHWWVGMKWNKLQLMLRQKGMADQASVSLSYPGVHLIKTERTENPNYLFVDIEISPETRAGTMQILIHHGNLVSSIPFVLKNKRPGNGTEYARGVTSADLVYLLMPDRFSNGDPSNDRFIDMNDTNCDRQNPYFRHGGDLQGITDHLGYFNELGVTTLWLTPVIENDQALTNEGKAFRSAYHGYAFTNQYRIDRRLGGNEVYGEFVKAAHAKGLKVIQDAVYNHVGDQHFLYLDQPSADLFNQWPSYTNTSFRDQPLVDPYSSDSDRLVTVNGWFARFMPDLNQRNPMVANYLIEYAIWAVEEFGIDGWRVDTYFYSDRNFLNRINQALYDEFPHITVFGENSMQSVTGQAYYCQNNIQTSWKSNLQGVIDFQWEGGALAGLNEPFGWSGGMLRLYNILVQDLLYKDPRRNQILLDNHDQDRFYSVVGEDFNKFKAGIVLLLTQRGIPQLYYGTEILMKNFKKPSDAEVRKDFPGGWKEDSVNKFLSSGKTVQENEAFEWIKTLALFRQKSSAISTGNTMQYVPKNGVYTYFRYDSKQTVMVAINSDSLPRNLAVSRFSERTGGFTRFRNVMTGDILPIGDLKLNEQEAIVLELLK
jgi:glycosidase